MTGGTNDFLLSFKAEWYGLAPGKGKRNGEYWWFYFQVSEIKSGVFACNARTIKLISMFWSNSICWLLLALLSFVKGHDEMECWIDQRWV
jgi:hypothetical protein